MLEELNVKERAVIQKKVEETYLTGHTQRELDFRVKIKEQQSHMILIPVFKSVYSYNGTEYQVVMRLCPTPC